jgi:choline-glycine betaine transporter
MSLKDIFEWIVNVNLFYVIGVVVVLIVIANIREWADANEKKVSELFGYFWIFGIMLFLFLLIIVVVS